MAIDAEKKTLDYGAFLADLEAKRSALDQAIASLRAVMAAGTSEGISSVNMAATLANPVIHNGEIPAGAFLGKSIPEAAKLYLSIVRAKQTTREIAEAMLKGGMETTSSNFENIVGAGIHRASKKDGEIVKVGRAWALAAWYPSGIRAAAAKVTRKYRKSKKSRLKEQTPKAEVKPSIAVSPVETTKPKERVLQTLRNQSGTELSLQEIAEHLRMERRAVNMVLIMLIRGKTVQKTIGGKYRLAA